MKRILLSAAAILLLAGPAYAVDIENQDQREYTISLDVEPGYWLQFNLAAGQTKKDSCPDVCQVSIEGIGWLSPGSDDKVIIKDGQLRLAPRS